jgi:hypothetical protein
MTNFAVVVAISSLVVVGLVVGLVRRITARSTGSADLGNVTVSRQWLIQHQSSERS